MVRRTDDSLQSGDTGGPRPIHEVYTIRGPFLGFQTDYDAYHPQDPRTGRDIQNFDTLQGDLVSRPGLRQIMNADDVATPTDRFPTPIDRIYAGYSAPDLDGTFAADWRMFVWGDYNFYVASIANRFTAAPTSWAKVQRVYVSGTIDEIAGAVVTGVGTTWDLVRILTNNGLLAPAFFKIDGDPSGDWTPISAVPSATSLTLSVAYPSGPIGPGAGASYTIVLMIVDWNTFASGFKQPVGTEAVRIPLSDPAAYYVCGAAGGTRLDPNSSTAVIHQDILDPIFYQADGAVIYANRLMLLTNRSFEAPNKNTSAQIYHDGRIAWSTNNDFTKFDFSTDPTAGFIDDVGIALGRGHSIFVMRGVMYVITENGIAAVHETGNPLNPLRSRTIVESKKFAVRAKAQVIDGRYAFILGNDAVYAFDGSNIQNVSSQINEHYRGMIGLHAPDTLATPNNLYYDDFRRRVFICMDNSNDEFYVNNLDDGSWLKHRRVAGVGGALSWGNTVGSTVDDRQDSEVLLFTIDDPGGSDKIFSFERSHLTDGQFNDQIESSIFTPSIDFGNTRDLKTLTRFKIIYRNTTAAAGLRVRHEVYVDGGQTPVVTGTITLGTRPGVGNDPGNGVLGAEEREDLTFSGISARSFRMKIISDQDPEKLIIKELEWSFVRKQEERSG